MVGYILRNTLSDHGTVNRGVATTTPDGYLNGIEERLKIGQRDGSVSYLEEEQAHELSIDSVVSMNFFGFHPAIFAQTEKMFHEFVAETAGQPRAEFLIPKVIDTLIQSGQAKMSVLTSEERWYGVTYQEDKPKVVEAFKGLLDRKVYPVDLW
jgi:NDP-sugar pyrophosphorylase family protein